MTEPTGAPQRPRPSTHKKIVFLAGLVTIGGLALRSSSNAPGITHPKIEMTEKARGRALKAYGLPNNSNIQTATPSEPYAQWQDDPANAIATPSDAGGFTRLDSLYDRQQTLQLDYPPSRDSLGGRNRPVLLTWSPECFPPESVRINAISGTVHIHNQLVLSWPVDKKWKRQEGVYLYGGPQVESGSDEHGVSSFATPPLESLRPLSTTAHYNHPFGERFVYRPENLDLLLQHAPPPPKGSFYDVHDIPFRTPAKQNPARMTFADVDYKYKLCAKMVHNLAHWAPRSTDRQYRPENNLFLLMPFWIESRENCLPALDPTIVNRWGYGGLPQFGLSNGEKNNSLGVEKRNSLVALRSIQVVDKNRRWRDITIDGKTLRGPEDLLRNWQAQVVCYYAFIADIIGQVQNEYEINRHRPHMKGVTLFGAAMGAYLTGNGSAVAFMRTGKTKADANHTTTESYIRHFSQLPMEHFRIPDTGLTEKTKEILTSAFSTTHTKSSLDIADITRRALKPMPSDYLTVSHAERMRLDRLNSRHPTPATRR